MLNRVYICAEKGKIKKKQTIKQVVKTLFPLPVMNHFFTAHEPRVVHHLQLWLLP